MRARRKLTAAIIGAVLVTTFVLLVPVAQEQITTPVTFCAAPPHGFGCMGLPDGGHFSVSASVVFHFFRVGAVYANVPCGINGSVSYPRFGSCGLTYSWQG